MLFRASERLNRAPSPGARAQGAVLALLVQALFILLLVMTHTATQTPRSPVHETLLLLRSLPKLAPPPRPITAPSAMRRPAIPLIIPAVPKFTPAPVLAPPSGIAGFGRSLFGCAPERYADLPPDEKAHCPKPGEGLAVNQPPDLNPPKSHAKDEALWQEELAERRWSTECLGVVNVLKCLIAQDRAEHNRIKAARQKIAEDKALARQEPKRPMPHIGVRRN